MPASFEGVVRKIKYKKNPNADCQVSIPPFWTLYVYAHCHKGYPVAVVIAMDEDGTLTIKPLWAKEEASAP
jgi:hypothetical protein